jgi:hypothetical protein
MKIAFHTPTCTFRGSCVALTDYAHYTQVWYGHTCIIVARTPTTTDEQLAWEWLRRRFPVRTYTTVNELNACIQDCDGVYAIKAGERDDAVWDHPPTLVHCVFHMREPHGMVYAAVSEYVARMYDSTVYVPHMVSLPIGAPSNHLRSILHIPSDAKVFGRYGGKDTFNVPFAMSVISTLVRQRHDRYFIFMNTPEWDTHPQLIFLPPTIDQLEKQRFIQTCDAMIVPERLGHTFGLAIAEFSIHQKPIIVYDTPEVPYRMHLDILGDRAIRFSNADELMDRLTLFSVDPHVDYNAYQSYTPEQIMPIFKRVFLDPLESIYSHSV